MKEITINITQEDIDKGKRMDPSLCPTALAFKRAYPDTDFIAVGTKQISFRPKGNLIKRILGLRAGIQHANGPYKLIAWISRYDRGQPVEPDSFTLAFKEWT